MASTVAFRTTDTCSIQNPKSKIQNGWWRDRTDLNRHCLPRQGSAYAFLPRPQRIWDLGLRISDWIIPKIRNPKSAFPNRSGSGARGRIRTFINLFLRQAPLPVGLRVRPHFRSGIWDCRFEISNPRSQIPNPKSKWSGQQDSNLRTLAPKASPYSHLWNAR